jgi:hypothetical protein
MYESTSLRVIVFRRERKLGFVEGLGCCGVGGKRNSLPMEETKATISTLQDSERIFSAMAPAATLPVQYISLAPVGISLYVGWEEGYAPIVSLALLLPPPLLARTPYFSMYVQSA